MIAYFEDIHSQYKLASVKSRGELTSNSEANVASNIALKLAVARPRGAKHDGGKVVK